VIRLTHFLGAAAIAGLVVFGAASAASAQTADTSPLSGVTTLESMTDAQRVEAQHSTRMRMMAGFLFILAAVAPFAVMKLIPFAEGIEALEAGAKWASSRPMTGLQLTGQGVNISGRNLSSLLGKSGSSTAGGGAAGGGMPGGKGKFSAVISGPGSGGPGSGGPGSGGPGSGGPGSGGPMTMTGEMDFGGGDDAGGGGGGQTESGGRRSGKYALAFATMGPMGVAGVYAMRKVRQKKAYKKRPPPPTP